MALVIDDSFLPATLSAPPMTDDEFAAFCAEHPDLRIEMTAEGELIIMPPTCFSPGDQNSEIGTQLRLWSKKDGRGKTVDSSTGFVLPNGARRSPDASWVLKTRIPQSKRDGFLHICPDFVIELRSPSDRLHRLKHKMHEYLDNGAQLGWLVDPVNQSVTIYRPNRVPETRKDINSIAGEEPVAGFVLDLVEVWNPLGE